MSRSDLPELRDLDAYPPSCRHKAQRARVLSDDIEDFARGLERIIGRPSRMRPFVCSGSPLICRTFIVGHNPASESERDFWTYWGPGGFDKTAWMAAYIFERASRPLRPGKTSRQKISATRRIIERVVKAADVPVLETNVYAAASADIATMPEASSRAFRFLVDFIRPSLVVAHGQEAAKAVDSLDLPCRSLKVAHFSRGWSYAAADALGHEIRALVA